MGATTGFCNTVSMLQTHKVAARIDDDVMRRARPSTAARGSPRAGTRKKRPTAVICYVQRELGKKKVLDGGMTVTPDRS